MTPCPPSRDDRTLTVHTSQHLRAESALHMLRLSWVQFAPVSKAKSLDTRLKWPCDRVVLEWDVAAKDLQQMVGEVLQIRQVGGTGRLQLQVMHCQPLRSAVRDSQALSFAYVLVPVIEETAPIGVTGVPADGWLSLLQFVASANSQALFADSVMARGSCGRTSP